MQQITDEVDRERNTTRASPLDDISEVWLNAQILANRIDYANAQCKVALSIDTQRRQLLSLAGFSGRRDCSRCTCRNRGIDEYGGLVGFGFDQWTTLCLKRSKDHMRDCKPDNKRLLETRDAE